MQKLHFTLLFIAIAGLAVADDFDDTFDDAFEDDPFADIVIDEPSSDIFSLDQTVSLGSTVIYNSNGATEKEKLWSGVTSMNAAYQPSVRYSPTDQLTMTGAVRFSVDGIFWLRGDDDWSDEVIEARQYRVDIRELLAQYRLDSWQLSTGVQNVTLGLADALSVANVLYAQNLSEPGATDIDDTLQPAWTSMISGAIGPVRLKLGSVHAHQINDIPEPGSDFDVVSSPSGMTLNEMLDAADLSIEPETVAFENMAWFGSASGVVGPIDWQVNGVSYLSHSPVVELSVLSAGPPPVIAPSALHYPRLNSGSTALSLVTGSFLWKAEAALTDGFQAQSYPSGVPGPLVEYQNASGTIGFDFDHSELGRLVAELQYSRILDYDTLDLPDSELSPDEQNLQWALIYRQSLLREQLKLTGQVIGFDLDSSGGRIQGIGAEYGVTDSLTVSVRVVDYVAGTFRFLNGADDRDRLIFSADYRF